MILNARFPIFLTVACTMVAFLVTPVKAGVVWDESLDGSLSTDRFSTTDLGTLSVGDNNVIADTQSGISKFFSLTIADGNQWSALELDQWVSEDDLGFLGVVENSFFDVNPASPDVTQLLGYVHQSLPFACRIAISRRASCSTV